ncbi:MAG: fatty acid desaturase [Pseudomonadota bacterium]
MPEQLIATERCHPTPGTDHMAGRIVWTPARSIWWFAMAAGGVLAVTLFASWGGFLVFILLSGATLLAGHSVGMHRLLIHRAFRAPRWVERLLVYLGVLVGMAGPFGMIRAHDMRDWHQRQSTCAPHPSHGTGFWRDAWWQLHCEFRLANPPEFRIEPEAANDPVYRFLERTWMAQQIPVALLLFALGGWGWVLWGVCLRVCVSLTGHWMVGHFAHRDGQQGWRIEGLPVQGYNIPWISLLAFGENWHGNHHAFPHSARMGVEKGQLDPGFWFVRLLEALRLASDVQEPTSQPARDGLVRVPKAPDAPLEEPQVALALPVRHVV